MRILVLGSGGREDALVQTFRRQGHDAYLSTEMQDADLVVVGPESYLAKGIADDNERVFGPTKKACRLETSKLWSKRFLIKYGIPTARVCDAAENVVIKPDGLTGGKGVICCDTLEEAKAAIEKQTGEFLIEEKLVGKELSLMAFVDGKRIVPMIPSQDHKKIFEGDLGSNTGGVGAYSPVPFLTDEMKKQIEEQIIAPTLKGLIEEKLDYKGVLYFGLMLTDAGPKVLEYNCRFGDPETQAVLPLLETDLAEVMLACMRGKLDEIEIKWSEKSSCCVVMTSKGYPGHFETGFPISGIHENEDLFMFHAGTKKDEQGNVFTNGGRVLNITAIGATLEDAIENAYAAVGKVHFENAYYRKDIGHLALLC